MIESSAAGWYKVTMVTREYKAYGKALEDHFETLRRHDGSKDRQTGEHSLASRGTESARSNMIALWHTIRQIYGKVVARGVANLVYANTKRHSATQVGSSNS